MAVESISDSQLHVVMFPFFAFGHVSPFIQLSNKLSSHGVRISFFTIPGFIPKVKTLIVPSPDTAIIPLEIPPSLGLSPDVAGTFDLPPSEAAKLIAAIDLTRPQVETLLAELKPHFVVFDFAQNWLPSLASELGIKTLFFIVLSAIATAYALAPTRLYGIEGIPTVEDLSKPPQGFPVRSVHEDVIIDHTSLLKTFEIRTFLYAYEGNPSGYQRIQENFNGCSAVLMKTCYEMEGPYLDFIRSHYVKPLITIGPLVPEQMPYGIVLDNEWAKWLAQFPAKSVIFSSFGSESFLTEEQIRELALGLELTGFPFLLVLNFPANIDARAELARALPLGFLERTKGRGLVHVGWVPQRLILARESVGCYLCHAGLSSLIEALVNDCQLVLLPIKSDQFFNAKLMGENGIMRGGVEVKRRDEDGYFGKEDIFAAVKTVMVEVGKDPGRSIRLSQKKWRNFFLDNDVQDKFISDLIVEMKKINCNSYYS